MLVKRIEPNSADLEKESAEGFELVVIRSRQEAPSAVRAVCVHDCSVLRDAAGEAVRDASSTHLSE